MFRRNPNMLYSNGGFGQIGVYFVMAVVFGSIAGFIAIYLVKTKKLKEWYPDAYSSPLHIIALAARVTAVIFVGSVTTKMILNGLEPNDYIDYLSDTDFLHLFGTAIVFFPTLLASILLEEWLVAKLQNRRDLTRSMASSAALGAPFLLYPSLTTMPIFDFDLSWLFTSIVEHLFKSFVTPFGMIKSIISGTIDKWYYPFSFIMHFVTGHRGNQFDIADSYPAILIAWMSGSAIAALGKRLR